MWNAKQNFEKGHSIAYITYVNWQTYLVLPTVGAGGSGSDFAERPDLFPTVAFFIVETT